MNDCFYGPGLAAHTDVEPLLDAQGKVATVTAPRGNFMTGFDDAFGAIARGASHRKDNARWTGLGTES